MDLDPSRDDPVFSSREEATEFLAKKEKEEAFVANLRRIGRKKTIDYCCCSSCRAMPSDEESYCCNELEDCNIKINPGATQSHRLS